MSPVQHKAVTGLLERKLVVISGKGGVGKSTICAVLARLAAGRKRRVLVIQSDPNVDAPVNLHNMLGTAPFGSEEKELHPNLWAIRIDPESATRFALMSVVRSRMLYEQFFRHDLVRGLFDAVPGLREAFIVYQVHALSHARRYDLVIWDAPPTGHLPLYLKAPQILSRMFNRGYVHKVLEGLTTFLRNPARVALCLVTLPEETPVSETMQLVRQLQDESLGEVSGVIINGFPKPWLTDHERRDLQAVGDALEDWLGREAGVGRALAETAHRREVQEKLAQEATRPLTGLGLPLWSLPRYPSGRMGLPEVDLAVQAWLGNERIRGYLLGAAEARKVAS